MSQNNGSNHYKDRKYYIVPYDPNWIILFEKYASRIKNLFEDAVIEHIGSTSVLGMSGKDCIDILVVVKDLVVVEESVEAMKNNNFEYVGAYVTKDSRLFRVIGLDGVIVLCNIHFFPRGHFHVKEMLAVRDYLRLHPEEVTIYSNLKLALYAKYPQDYSLYRKYKDEYMNELNKKVLV